METQLLTKKLQRRPSIQPIMNRSFCTKVKNTNLFFSSYYEKVLNLWLIFKKYAIVNLFLKNIIIGSLLLILTKLFIEEYLILWSRIFLLILYISISMWYDIREKIKFPIALLLQKSLGYPFLTFDDSLEKEDYLINSLPEGAFMKEGYHKLLYTIKFEIIWFLQYLFQRFYIFIHYIRLFFDTNPILYIIVYYNIFFTILYYDSVYIMSYIGLFLIFTKLLLYISENNFAEVVANLTLYGYNEDLKKKD